ncbi:MAG: Xaa-Pro peptidase family protein [Hyphomicrobiaceae bacterium]
MLQFERHEYEARLDAARRAMRELGLAGMLLFAPESHYYLTGYDTGGYVFFQCLVLTADGRKPVLLTRRPDLEQARITSIIEDVRLWYDTEGGNPAVDLRELCAELKLMGEKIGIELDNYGLTGANHARVAAAFAGFATLIDASALVRHLRIIKSPAEQAYVRRAAALADASLLAQIAAAGPGVPEGEVHAAGHAAIYLEGGDVAAAGPVLGAGERALLSRTSTGFGVLKPVDQLTLEFAGAYRHYHACLMRTLAIGEATARQRDMFEATREALAAMTEAIVVGRPLGEIDDAHRRVYDARGYAHARYSACGYSLGATYSPNWMDVPPMLYSGNPWPAAEGMVLFLHAILMDASTGYAMSAGYTVIVGAKGPEVLSQVPVEYQVCTGTAGFRGWAKGV